ncbi:hypothetical protein ALC57_13316 [Trachymyrmex cornetzi]|uniref:HAT C-terminal dimerisation domain-containing protein n=1 Tax=Trachymyrmex cornetzi TaxID=471704 RepID=A0A151IZF0_9HYME|nr:hypothetical protein ALC57_13316 [Trachymyrmex cornetzi]
MERAKKMVLISTENLERMQHQLRQNPTSFADGESKEIAVPQNSDNTASTNSTAQTPGTHLTRLDAEMGRILNSDWPRDESERWKMYREALWRYLRFIQETRRQKDARSENAEDNATRDGSADNETTSNDVFHDLTQTFDIPPAHSISNTGIITKNFEISSDHNHAKNNHAMKSIEEIVESVPKSYHGIFYEQELARVEKNVEEEQFIVDRVIKSKGRGANKQVLVKKKDLPKFDSTTDRDKTNTNVSQTSSIFENSTTHVLAKEVNSEFTHTFPLLRSFTPKNEFTGSFKRLTSSRCPICGGLSCRPTAEGVDEKQIPFSNILALSCDNASVMTGKYESFKIKLQKHCKSLIMMPSPCHTSALVANAACSATPEACEELLRKVASFISSSPKRACIFEQFQKSFCFDGSCSKIIEEIKVYLLQSAAENLLKIVLKNVVKAPLLNFVSIDTINPLLACNRLSPDQVMVGEACQDLLDRLNQERQGEIVKSVYENCLAFYDITAKEIRNKLFVKNEFLCKLRIFEPKFALQQEDEKNTSNNSVQVVLFVAQRFGGFDEEILKEEWQFLKFVLPHVRCYNILYYLINAIRFLPNSNADAERVFSMLTDVKTKKRNKLHPSNNQSLCVFKSILRARGETARTMIVDTRHLTLMSENLYKTNARENTQ